MGWLDGYKKVYTNEDTPMTIRKLIHELTDNGLDLDDEVSIKISNRPVESGKGVSWKSYPINRVNLFTPTWYIGDQCILTIGKIKEK